MGSEFPIRPARRADVRAMRAVERAAGEVFRSVGMGAIADDEPLRPSQLRAFVDDGRAWVAEHGPGGAVVAYLIAAVVDGAGHIEQVSVHPDHAGHRIGAALVERAGLWAGSRNLPAITLTTFRDVAWNGPYYERLGFGWMSSHEIDPELRAIRTAEVASGLDVRPRGCMRRSLA